MNNLNVKKNPQAWWLFDWETTCWSCLTWDRKVMRWRTWTGWTGRLTQKLIFPSSPLFVYKKGDEEWGSISLGSWDPLVRAGKWWIFHQRVTSTGDGDTDRLDKRIRKAGSVIGCKLNTFEAVLKRKSPLSNPDHPLHHILDRKRKRLYFNIFIYIFLLWF